MKDTSQVIINQATKGMIKDLNSSLIDEKTITHHRNGMFQTINGDISFATNEPSNLDCITLPYKFNGSVPLTGSEHMIFSTDNIDSEIGIANTDSCTYSELVNDKCLGLNTKYPISGFLRINAEGEQEVIFTNGFNNDRIINRSKIPYIYKLDDDACQTKLFTNKLDCDELLLNPKITIPCLVLSKSNRGNLPDGVYSVAIAYSIDKQKFSDYYGLTTPIMINNEVGDSSLSIQLSNLDRSFDTFQLILIGVVNGTRTNKIIGTFPTSQTLVTISDWENDEYQSGLSSTELTVMKKVYDYTGILAANSQYLMRADIKRKPKVNYQKQAFNIKAEYVVKQVPLSYYKNRGEDISYFRDENYNFLIRFFWKDGEATEHFQIANRKKRTSEAAAATGDDIFELDKNLALCDVPEKVETWQAFNTASAMKPVQG